MNVQIVTPAPRGSRYGNRTTALRWARLLRESGHRVTVTTEYAGRKAFEVLVVLHARRSAASIRIFREQYPDAPLVLCLTGTDVYQDIATDAEAQRSLELADRLIVLQPLAAEEVPVDLRWKVRTVVQSARPTPGPGPSPAARTFDLAVVGHLRDVKDPLRAAEASRLLPPSSKIRVVQVGGALDPNLGDAARAEMRRNPRYRWLGELPGWRTRRIMKRSQALVLTSKLEGGANVVSEALSDGIAVVSSDIAGSRGLLGGDYPGYFPVGDSAALAAMLRRLEEEPSFLDDLRERCRRLTPMVLPGAENAALEAVLAEVCGT